MSKPGRISFSAAVLMSMNIMVGAGILGLPTDMARISGSLSYVGWILVALLVFPVVWSMAQVGTAFPGGAGVYHYAKTGLNKTAGFFAHLTYTLGYFGTVAVLITFLARSFVAQLGWMFPVDHPLLFNMVMLTVFSLLNLLDIKLISRIQSGATVLKLVPLFVVIFLFAFYWNGSELTNFTSQDVASLPALIPIALFGFWGLEAACTIGHLLKDGAESVGRVILTAFSCVVALYVLFHFGLVHIMGGVALAEYGVIGFPTFMGLSPAMAKLIQSGISASIIFSFMNSVFGLCLANVSNIELLAKNNLVFGSKTLTKMNRYDRPAMTVLFYAIILWLLMYLIPSLEAMVGLTNMGVTGGFVFILLALLNTFYKKKQFGRFAMTVLGFMSCCMLIYFSWMSIAPTVMMRFVYVSPLIIGLIAGGVMYYMLNGKKALKGQTDMPEIT